MTENASITLNENQLCIAGEINFVTAVSLLTKSLPLLATCDSFIFDFSKVTTANSAILALLIEWLKLAKRHSKSISFENVPVHLLSVATMAGADTLFTS